MPLCPSCSCPLCPTRADALPSLSQPESPGTCGHRLEGAGDGGRSSIPKAQGFLPCSGPRAEPRGLRARMANSGHRAGLPIHSLPSPPQPGPRSWGVWCQSTEAADGAPAGALRTECAFEAGTPSPGEAEAPASPEPVKSEQGFGWQEPGELEAEATGATSERNKKAQLDRLDINVQIDDSYLVEAGDRQKRWQCRMCEKSYTSKYNLVTHILGHNGIKPHSCPHCNKLFKQPSHLQTHLLTHQGTRPHKCEVCSKAFTQTSHLKRHMLLHTDIKPYSCRFCGRGFAYPSELKAHEVKHESGRCHVCVECGLDFSTLTQLKRHLSTHQGPTLYQCLECSKSFHYRSQLQNHMLKHQNVRPFVCTECGMEFSQIHHLKQHSLTHKGVKEFKCEVCGREFTLQANMKRHMLIHTSVRPYQCHICFKTFVQKQTLKTHMIVHSPVKPFKCKVCGKSFNRMYNLLGHMHLHAGSKPFKCPYCSSKFNLKGNLSRHMKVKHGVMDISLDSQGGCRLQLGTRSLVQLNLKVPNVGGFPGEIIPGPDCSQCEYVNNLLEEPLRLQHLVGTVPSGDAVSVTLVKRVLQGGGGELNAAGLSLAAPSTHRHFVGTGAAPATGFGEVSEQIPHHLTCSRTCPALHGRSWGQDLCLRFPQQLNTHLKRILG
uniref:Zinc finger protein 710 n=1 Tax=Athene cunicularia TaxID=194338 RepID=A0A663MRY0_ATHCN